MTSPGYEVGGSPSRETWANSFQFFSYCLSYSIGFGNVWRFPYLCYKNGGAAFLIPYTVMLLSAGLPNYFLELSIGQYVSLSPATLYPKMVPVFSGLGWGMIMNSLLTAVYFSVIIAWSLFYIYASFSSSLPWGHCDNDFNSVECFAEQASDVCRNQSLYYYNRTCLSPDDYCGLANLTSYNETHCYNPSEPNVTKAAVGSVYRFYSSEDFFRNRMLRVTGRTWEDMGGMQWELVGCLALAWVIIGACLAKGIRTTGKIVYFTAFFPYAVFLILFIRGITLNGAYEGIEFYMLKPNITRLMDVEVWQDAAIQIFYSLGICFGGLITLASYNKFDNNCMRDAFVIAFSNCSTSVFVGFVIFSVLGFLAQELGVEIKDVIESGSGLVFVVYPAAISMMPLPQLWSVLFFMMFITVGLGTQFTLVETVVTALTDQFKWMRQRKATVVVVTCILFFLMSVPMCLEGGIYMFELFVFYAASVSLIIISIVQLCSVQFLYGFRRLVSNIEEMGIRFRGPVYCYYTLTWLLLTPAVLMMIVFGSIYYHVPAYWGNYVFPKGIQILGWFLCISSAGCIPLGILYTIYAKKKKGIKALFETSPDFCPSSTRQLMEASRQEPCSKFRYTHDNNGYVHAE
ncbi:sodium- and chloride-dependent glycine transporter 2-like [Panulirus ornatus]|uniref:sodium- and chloride-dependent glycine transporter 2-like n=1 Tax=Panulirus ornatus TaxID=150431 RepID=UPI003A8513D3